MSFWDSISANVIAYNLILKYEIVKLDMIMTLIVE